MNKYINDQIHVFKLVTKSLFLVSVLALLVFFILTTFQVANAKKSSTTRVHNERLLTIYDRGVETTILTTATTLRQAFEKAGIVVDQQDVVEPSLDEELVASDYRVNIYRARPVVIIDGKTRLRVVTAFQTAKQIIASAGLQLAPEDRVTMKAPSSLQNGMALTVEIERALVVNLTLYGRQSVVRTFSPTVADFLKEKNLKLESSDRVSVGLGESLVSGQVLRIWREGKQVTTVEEEVAFAVDKIEDADRPIGYHEIRKVGVKGLRQVSYEILTENGAEVSRTEIASVVLEQPVAQIEAVGVKGKYTTPSENEKITWDYLIEQGFTPIQTAGIMGNLKQEHRFHTSDTPGGLGIAQWTGGRRANLMSWANYDNIYTQLDFLMFELNNSYPTVLDGIIKNSNDLVKVVQIFQNQFERCGICRESTRIGYARDILATHHQ